MCNRLAAYTLRCTHGRVYRNYGASTFEERDVGPSNVVTEFIKHVRTKGAMKGKQVFLPSPCPLFSKLHVMVLFMTSYINMISFIRIDIHAFDFFSIRNGWHEIKDKKKNYR